MKILHLSDLHLGNGGVDYDSNLQKMARVFNGIIVKYPNPEEIAIVITGDIVNDGKKWQYQLAKPVIGILKSKGYKLLMVPGNHDYGTLGLIQEENNLKYFSHYFNTSDDYPIVQAIVHDNINYHFILLNSQYVLSSFARGELGDDQLVLLNQELKRIKMTDPTGKIIVCLHHHPFHDELFEVLIDAENFKSIIKQKLDSNGQVISKVDILLFGHKHAEKRFQDKEKSYGVDIIFASGNTAEIINRKNLAVFKINEIDPVNMTVTPIYF